jgi:hypothetical protein
MKAKRNLNIVLTAVLVIAAISTVAWDSPGPDSKECGLIGTWYGHAYSSMKWLAVHTAGSKDARNGEMLLNWVFVSSGLLQVNGYPATSLTPGHGVWELTDKGPCWTGKGQYNYTWYAYGLNDSGNVVYSLRVRGLAKNTDCDNVAIDFTYEVFDGLVTPQDMSESTPVYTIQSVPGKSGETRVPLVTP